jgi:flagellar export protein FliJ
MNLPRLLAYRSQMEEALRIELASAARALQESAERSLSCEAEVKIKQQRYADATQSGLTVEEACRWYDEIDMASVTAGRAAEAHRTRHQEWMAKQGAVVEAMQERKKLDILVKRRQEARQQQQLHEDQRLMDELAARRRRGDAGRVAPTERDAHG